jgi:hypothetical protein
MQHCRPRNGPGHITAILCRATKWRSLKYEDVFLTAYASVKEARGGIGAWFNFYNDERLYQALVYKTPYEIFTAAPAYGYVDNATVVIAPAAHLSIFTPRSTDSFTRAVKKRSPFCFIHGVRVLGRVRREMSATHHARPHQAGSIEEEHLLHALPANFTGACQIPQTPVFPLQSIAREEFNLRDDACTSPFQAR